ncbi:MAG TPA: hypothetical protein VJ821_03370 [Anaerolineales bacterium]|nr:hypothetical protein [Anaerolineales bacterium]
MKLPFDLSLKLVFRVLLPGFILAAAFVPLLRILLTKLNLSAQLQIGYIVLALLLGWLVIVMDMHIYMLYEGRRYWRRTFFWDWLLKREKARLKRVSMDANEGPTLHIQREASVELRRFPIDENGEFVAEYPTRLGNLLTSFEGYSKRIYGMDSIFYWPRLWLTLDKDLREEIDGLQAMADSTVYASLSFYVMGLAGLVYALLKFLNVSAVEFLPEPPFLLGLAFAALLLGYLTYRISLHLHDQFGEMFKSVFDVYHDKVLFPQVLAEVGRLTGDSQVDQLPKKMQYRKIWRYLHNYRVKLTEEGKSYTPNQLEQPPPVLRDQPQIARAVGFALLLIGIAIQLWKAFYPNASKKK